MVDCFDGKVVSWSLSTRPDAELTNTMLEGAIDTLNALLYTLTEVVITAGRDG